MKKTAVKWLIGLGAFCLTLVLGAAWYAMTFNEGRLVTLTDFSTYVFRPADLPMILAIVLLAVYVVVLVALVMKVAFQNIGARKTVTRSLNPKLGLLGILGFLGFSGIWTYRLDGSIFPFCFFLFFGFFGFFFEGKMSGTFMDERFRENAQKAQLVAYKVGFILLFLLLLLVGRQTRANLDLIAIIYVVAIALILALVLFLSEYLLYRYDFDDRQALEEDG